MTSARRATVGLALLMGGALGGCDERTRTPSTSEPKEGAASTTSKTASEPRAAPEGMSADGPGCTLGEPRTIVTLGETPNRLDVVLGSAGGLVAYPAGGGALHTIPVDPSGRPRGAATTVELPAAQSLLALRAVEDAFVASSLGRCEAARDEARCLHLRWLDETGNPASPPLTVPLGPPLLTLRIAASSSALFVAHSPRRGPPAIHRIAPDGEIERISLGEGLDLEETRVEVLALAAAGDRWAAVWRAGPAETPTSEVILSTPAGEHAVEALHDALVIESVAWTSGTDLSLVAGFEFSRPHLFRLAEDGTLHGSPDMVHPGARLPDALERLGDTRTDRGPDGLTVRPLNAAGDPWGAVEPLRTEGPVAVTRGGTRRLVVYPKATGGDTSLEAARLACGG